MNALKQSVQTRSRLVTAHLHVTDMCTQEYWINYQKLSGHKETVQLLQQMDRKALAIPCTVLYAVVW